MKGSQMIKICSILLLISGICSVIGGAVGFLALSFVAAFGGPVFLLVIGCILVIASGILSIMAGSKGNKNCSNPAMANMLIKWGLIIMAMSLIGNIFQMAANGSFGAKSLLTMISGLIIPGLYTFGAYELLTGSGQKFSFADVMAARTSPAAPAQPMQPQQYAQAAQTQPPVQPQQYAQTAQAQAPVQPQQYAQPKQVQPQQYAQPIQAQAPVQPQQYAQAAQVQPPMQPQQYAQPAQAQPPVQPQQYTQPVQTQAPYIQQAPEVTKVPEFGAAPAQPQPDNGLWTCRKCGHAGNTGRFCIVCGAGKDQA